MLLIWRLLPAYGARQLLWMGVGTAALLVILHSPKDLRWLRRYRYLWWTGGLLLTSLTLLFGTHPSGGEPRLWLGCCGVYFQPSEPLRLLLIAFLASYFSERMDVRDPGDRSLLPVLVPVLAVWGLSIGLLVVQRDLGTGSLFVALLTVLLYLASDRWQVLLAGAAVIGLGGVLGTVLFDVVQVRFMAWLDPWADPLGGSYQIVQSLIALASGGLMGSGPGLGSPGFVPAAHTDFIFAALVEEWGFLGGVAVLGLFAILASRGLKAALGSRDPFAMLLLAGLGTAFGMQAILIIGGVIRLLPLTGVTLPFMSYGGSSLLTSYIALGFMLLLSGGETGRSPISRPLRRIHVGIVGALFALALLMGWWSIGSSADLTARADNPRPAITSLYVRRGEIMDRNGKTLAVSVLADEVYRRQYPASVADHLVGYDSLVIGKTGLERSLDPWLSGEQGYTEDVILGQRILTGFPPPGLDVRLSLDLELQRAAETLLAEQQGAAMILDVRSGEILAMASSPTFDADELEANWDKFSDREDAPLLNRATQAAYQPGMALAPFLAAWAQEQGRSLNPREMSEIDLDVPVYVNGDQLDCLWSRPIQDGDLREALRMSCPAPFAEMGERLRGEELVDMTRSFGLDRSVDLRLIEADPPELTAPLGIQGVRRAAVGQGALTVTPLQVIRAWASFFNAGRAPAIRLVLEYEDPRGSWQPIEPTSEPLTVVSAQTAAVMRNWLRSSPERYEFQAQALAGEGRAVLGWYMGALMRNERGVAVLIAVENEPPTTLRALGDDLLDAAETALQ